MMHLLLIMAVVILIFALLDLPARRFGADARDATDGRPKWP